MALMPFSQ